MSSTVLKPFEKESRPVTVDGLRRHIFLVGVEAMTIMLRRVDGGYEFVVQPRYSGKGQMHLVAEKSSRKRVFKSVEAALRVGRDLGFDSVQVML